MKRLVIDTDPGVDDAHAILLAAAHPDAHIEAVTTMRGNVSLKKTTENALKILDAAQIDAPVFAGCAGALVRSESEDAGYVHGEDGLGDCGLPASKRRLQDEHAVQALIRLANENKGELTLVAIGPLTNLAVALQLDPALPQKYQSLVVMGGAIYAQGNTSSITAEFNIYSDPEAAAVVFDRWGNITVSSWETNIAHPVSQAAVRAIRSLDTPRGVFYNNISAKTARFIRDALGKTALLAADAIAMAAAIEPEIVTKAEKRYVDIELCGALTRGQTVVDWAGTAKKEPNANLVLKINQARLDELLIAALQ